MNDKSKIVKKTFYSSIKEKILKWADDDFYIPVFVFGTGCTVELISYLSLESSNDDMYIADRDMTSLKPDLLVIAGLINYRALENIKREYNALVGRKYVVVIGDTTQNIHGLNNYNLVDQLENHIPVDLYIHGNPPNREEIIASLNSLKDIRS